jgi:wyosine [tRNA(Phe)-imidazoG37] synthetase (radical SAM superfamily)
LTKGEYLVSPEYRIKLPPSSKFRKELKSILIHVPHLDSITFGYNGEPTLNEKLLDFLEIAIDVRKELTWETKKPLLTLFTNSSTIHFDEIRERVKQFELVLAKIDVGIHEYYKHINRPHHKTPKLDETVNALVKLKQEMPLKNKLAIQCLIFNSYKEEFKANSTEQNITELAEALKRIKPDVIQIYSTARIPAEYFVYAISDERKKEIVKIIKNVINDEKVKIEWY